MENDNNINEIQITDPASLGAAIRVARKAARLTQSDLAMVSGVGVRFLVELEKGKPGCEIGRSLTVAKAVGLELLVRPHLAVNTSQVNRPFHDD